MCTKTENIGYTVLKIIFFRFSFEDKVVTIAALTTADYADYVSITLHALEAIK